jgi:sugar phosphate isomerase/epimerase
MTKSRQDTSRRDFLQFAGLLAAGSCAVLTDVSRAQGAAPQGEQRSPKIELALASYTTRKFDLEQTLAMTKRVGLPAICLKSFHLPLDASPEVIAAAAATAKQAGLKLYGCGVVTMRNAEQVNQAFGYAKAAGMSRIMAAPSVAMLSVLDEKVKQYDLQVCIHNHGPGDDVFPTPDVAYQAIKDLDRRIGLCHDVGHTLRYGADPIAQTEKCADRIYDVHIKDVTAASKAGDTIPCGRGVIDLPNLLRTMVKTGYKGYLAFEYESEESDPLPGLAESVGYVRGVLDSI